MLEALRDDAFDVAVIGAGPAGASTALRLAQHRCRVLLVDRTAFDTPRAGETLAPSVQPLLSDIGVWDRFLALKPIPSWGTRSIWGGPEPQEHSHVFSPYGSGWHIDRKQFDRMLAEAAEDAGATLSMNTRLVGSERQENDRWRLTLRSGNQSRNVTADVVVDATGRYTQLGQRLGGKHAAFDKLIGVAVQFKVTASEQHYTLVEAVASGWWYSAPISTNRLMVMLLTDSDICRSGKLTLSNSWLTHLRAATATSFRVGSAPIAGGPSVFGAASRRLRRSDTTSRWIAVGDAALAVDPISGSGVVRALSTAGAGAAAVLDILQGSCEAIDRYEAERERECVAYLEDRALYYGMEKRWHNHAFWHRRIRHC